MKKLSCSVLLFLCAALQLSAAVSFLGVAADDASPSDVVLWIRATDAAASAAIPLILQVATDPSFASLSVTTGGTTDPAKDYTLKVPVAGLQPATTYYYRFLAPGRPNE